jgi:integrase
MPIYKRVYTEHGAKKGVWWFSFYWNGQHIQRSTGLPVGPKENAQKARNAESECRAALNKGNDERTERARELDCKREDLTRCPQCEKLFDGAVAVTFGERKFCGKGCADKWDKDHNPAPTLKEFSQRFIDEIQVRCKAKPNTVSFYALKLTRLLEFEPLASALLDSIDESLIAAFVQWRSSQASRAGHNRKKACAVASAKPISAASVNRELATLRRLLRLAQEWRVIDRVPRIRLLRGERNREFVLSHAQERLYLEMAPEPLHDAAMLMLDTGLRVGEVLALEWADVHLEPVGAARFGFIHIPKGKSLNAKRNVSLTPRVRAMLENRYASRKSVWVFTDAPGTGPLPIWTVGDQHKRMRTALKLPADAVIHSFRHTFGTRLGEAGADAFTIMRAMGHSSVVVSQKYVHPTPEAMERAFDRLNAANEKALASLPGSPKPALTATVPATVAEGQLRPAQQVV